MKRKSYCGQCKVVKPYRLSLHTKAYAGPWTILLFDCLCNKCDTITFQNIEATASIEGCARKSVIMSSAKTSLKLDLVEMFENVLTKLDKRAVA